MLICAKILVLCLLVNTRPWSTDGLRSSVASRVLQHHVTRFNMKEIEVFCNCNNECKLVMLVEFAICWEKITGNSTMSPTTHSTAWELLQTGPGKSMTFQIRSLPNQWRNWQPRCSQKIPYDTSDSESGTKQQTELQVSSLPCLRIFNPTVLPSLTTGQLITHLILLCFKYMK